MVTTIQIDEKLKDKLDELKVHHREGYNDLIVRLISNKTYIEKILIELVEVAEKEVYSSVIGTVQGNQYYTAISLFKMLTEDFIRERSDLKKRMERVYMEAFNFFISSTPTSEPTRYAGSIIGIIKEAKRQLNLTFGNINYIDSLEKVIEEVNDIREDKKFDKYENAHYGMYVDWGEYTKRENAVNEEMKKILEGLKKRD